MLIDNKKPDSPVLDEEQEIDNPVYTDKEKLYLGGIKKRLTIAQQQRDTTHEAFDGMNYIQRCQQNRRFANTYIKPKINREEVNFSTGISRTKLMTQLASLVNLNLASDITAYDERSIAIADLGEAVEDIIEKSSELDNGEEKILRRQYTLLEQGEVFVEAIWKKGWFLKKTLQKFKEGDFKGVKINARLKKVLGKLKTNILKNEKVYLGSISTFDIEEQPFLFTVDVKPYAELEPLFKDFEMWKYVKKSLTNISPVTGGADDGYSPFWNITGAKKGSVEIVKYQDKNANEFQVFLNGIPMLPIGYPLEEISPDGEYNMIKQVLEIIDEHFAYGKSLMQRLKTSAALEDEFWRLAIVKGQQGYKPPMVNNTGRILSSRIFMPGVMTSNIPEGKLKQLLDNVGLNNSDVQILTMLRDSVEDNSTEPQVSGQQPKGDPTATQIATVQQQAEKLLGLTITSAILLEKKITGLLIPLILKNWFDPVDNKVDKVKNELVNTYRSISVKKPIDGQGMGQEIVEVREEAPTPFQVFQEQEEITERTGIPTKKIVLIQKDIINAKYLWRVSIVPKPKRTSNLQKLMLREKVDMFALSPNFNMDWFEQKAAITFDEDPQKVFNKGVAQGIARPEVGASKVGAKTPLAGAEKNV